MERKMASFTKRGARWQAQVRANGVSVSKTFSSKQEARLWAAQMEAGVVDHSLSQQHKSPSAYYARTDRSLDAEHTPSTLPISRPQITFGELLDRYEELHLPHIRSQTQEVSRLKKLRAAFGEKPLMDISPTTLVTYRQARLREVSSQTVKHELSFVLRVMRLASNEWGYTLPNGVPVIKLPKLPRGRSRRLEQSEQVRLERALPEIIGKMMVFSLETALRRGELVSMQWEHVDLHRRLLTVPVTKTDEPRTIPLTTTAVRLLRSLPRNLSGDVWGVEADSVSQRFARVCKRLDIKDLHWHDLRHEAISRLVERGLNTMEASLISGHRSLSCLQRYTHLKAENLLEKIG
jgi:integrase